jgi:hypothetical protein
MMVAAVVIIIALGVTVAYISFSEKGTDNPGDIAIEDPYAGQSPGEGAGAKDKYAEPDDSLKGYPPQ